MFQFRSFELRKKVAQKLSSTSEILLELLHIRNFREIFFIPKKYGMFLTRQAQAAENGGNRIW